MDWDGSRVRFNTTRGRTKDRNLTRRPHAVLSIQDSENPCRHVEVRGRVAQATEAGADAHIDALARKYLGRERYPWRRPGETRVTYRIVPERVLGT